MTTTSETALSDRLENDIRELRGAGPYEMARRLIERGWSQPATEGPDVELLAQAIEMIGTRVVSDNEAGWRLYAEDVAHEYDRLAATEPAATDGVRDAAIEYVLAERAYLAALDEHKDWTPERRQAEADRDPEAWFGPWDRRQRAANALAAAVDAALAAAEPAGDERT